MGKSKIERPKLHKIPKPRHLIIDPHNKDKKSGTYVTDQECIEAGDICASPALFEK